MAILYSIYNPHCGVAKLVDKSVAQAGRCVDDLRRQLDARRTDLLLRRTWLSTIVAESSRTFHPSVPLDSHAVGQLSFKNVPVENCVQLSAKFVLLFAEVLFEI